MMESEDGFTVLESEYEEVSDMPDRIYGSGSGREADGHAYEVKDGRLHVDGRRIPISMDEARDAKNDHSNVHRLTPEESKAMAAGNRRLPDAPSVDGGNGADRGLGE